jgi:hypothetical protein
MEDEGFEGRVVQFRNGVHVRSRIQRCGSGRIVDYSEITFSATPLTAIAVQNSGYLFDQRKV